MKKGRVQVYTGDGKGKTSAALGLAVRAALSGLSVIIVQFLKGRESAELGLEERFDNLKIDQFGSGEFIVSGKPAENDLKLAGEGLKAAREALAGEEYDVVVLDEINTAVDLGILDLGEVLRLVDERPEGVELILTGRGAPREFIQMADLVTEMKNVRHYFDRGVPPRKGIEW
ncbi:MAG: cob(I)yrinic acid a,c-diamide adenosyltransferase [Actinobacteria bacterium]|nr:cob(I)yrinic acid a,c-diamide adenosyltransferase [Actinomycetota bacterium]